MITLTSIVLLLFIIFLLNSAIINSAKNQFPKNSAVQNLKATEKIRQTILIVGLVIVFISVVYINFFL